MPYQIATLIWLLLIVGTVFSGAWTFSKIFDFLDGDANFINWKTLLGTALTVILGWSIWIIYPFTAGAM